MWLKTSVGIILGLALLLQGCGRKGPLTMPAADAHQPAPVTESAK